MCERKNKLKQKQNKTEILGFIGKICSPPSVFIVIDVSGIDCSLLAALSGRAQLSEMFQC